VRLGGEDFDEQLAELIARRALEEKAHDVRADGVSWARVRAAAERAKRQLSEQPSVTVALYELPFRGERTVDFETTITREQAEAAWAPLLERLVGPIQRALRDAGLRPEQVGVVLLVGGATRMPCVAHLRRAPESRRAQSIRRRRRTRGSPPSGQRRQGALRAPRPWGGVVRRSFQLKVQRRTTRGDVVPLRAIGPVRRTARPRRFAPLRRRLSTAFLSANATPRSQA